MDFGTSLAVGLGGVSTIVDAVSDALDPTDEQVALEQAKAATATAQAAAEEVSVGQYLTANPAIVLAGLLTIIAVAYVATRKG